MDKLIVAPGTDPNQYYATRLPLHSPFITLIRNNKKILCAGGFEYPQAKAKYTTVRFEEFGKTWEQVLTGFMKKYQVKNPVMPANTPANIAQHIKGATLENDFFPQRTVKTKEEIRAIKTAQVATEEAILAVRDILSKSKIVNGKAQYKGQWLTSEHLKRVAAVTLALQGMNCPDMIIASGKQSALPHDTGSGIIREGAVVVDIFPKSTETFYHADCTRTYLIGKAPKHFDGRYAAVATVQREAMKQVRAGANHVEKYARDMFTDMGFSTDFKKGTGYIHSLGHGVGLDLHENPRFSAKLQTGNVMTIEPGLYYEYGIRIEDMGVVTKTGFSNFTKIDKDPYL